MQYSISTRPFVSKLALGVLAGTTIMIGSTAIAAAQSCVEEVGLFPTGAPIQVEIKGTVAWALQPHAFVTFDISQPSNPVRLGAFAWRNDAAFRQFASWGHYAVIAVDPPPRQDIDPVGVAYITLDLSDPSRPVEVWRWYWGFHEYETLSVAVVDHYACLASSEETSVRMLDISDPARPAEVPPIELPLRPTAMVVSGDLIVCYGYDGPDRFVTVDVSSPLEPSITGGFNLVPGSFGLAMVTWSDHLYVPVSTNTIAVAELTGPLAPRPIATVDISLPDGVRLSNIGRGVATEPERLLLPILIEVPVIDGGTGTYLAGGLAVLDISDPSLPTLVGSIEPLDVRILAMDGEGELLAMADESGGIRVGELGTNDQVTIVGRQALPGGRVYSTTAVGHSIVARGGYPSETCWVFDAADPSTTQAILAEPSTSGGCRGVVGLDNTTVGAMSSGLLWLYDLTDPSHPNLLSVTPSTTSNTLYSNGHLITIVTTDGLEIVDASDRAALRLESVWRYDIESDNAWLGDRLVFTPYDFAGLGVLDLSVPSAPALATWLDPDVSGGYAPAARNGVLYQFGYDDNLLTFDSSDPAHPTLVGDVEGSEGEMDFFGTTMVTLAYRELQLFDLEDPWRPRLMTSMPVLGSWFYSSPDYQGLVVTDDGLVGVATNAGVEVFDISRCEGLLMGDDFESGDLAAWSLP